MERIFDMFRYQKSNLDHLYIAYPIMNRFRNVLQYAIVRCPTNEAESAFLSKGCKIKGK